LSIILQATQGLLLSTNQKKCESKWRNDCSYKLIYSIKGSMYYQTERSDIFLSNNEFILFNPNELHRQISVDNHKFLIELDPTFLNQLTADISCIKDNISFALTVQKHPLVQKWVHFINDYVQIEEGNESHSVELFLDHSFTQLALMIFKVMVGTHSSDINIQPFKEIHPALYKTMNVIKEDFQHAWSLDEMAGILNISKFQFAHLFKEYIGISPFSWLQLYRIIRSQDMLIHTKKSIVDISYSCGFSSISVYNQLFKRLYGITPSFFRRKYAK